MRLKSNGMYIIITAAIAVLLFGVALARAAGTGEPGSSDDPLVTRSYLEAQVNARVASQVESAVKVYSDKYMKWQVVDLSPGQRLEGKAGSELIVRAGKAVVVDPVGSGIPDVTAGLNITAGQVVSLDHYLIIPRADGRGISARTKTLVMYKGEVEIK
ncbi:MAG: hypothetical protein ACYDEQ_14315 [Desulfocucumaceae bacterium]